MTRITRATSWRNTVRRNAVLWGLLILFLVLPLADIFLFGFRRIFQYLSGDVFYYLTVAANFPRAGFFTFDQSLPTNSFHPLWQSILVALAFASQLFAEPRTALIVLGLALSMVLASAGLLLTAWSAERWLENVDFALLLIPAGVTAFVCGVYSPRYCSLWTQLNGMESGLSLFFFGIFVVLLTGEKEAAKRPWLRLGLAVGLLTLSRLDLIFFFPALAVVGVLEICSHRDKRALIRGYFTSLALGSLLVVTYMAVNVAATGHPVPISSRVKSHFPNIFWSNTVSSENLLTYFTEDSRMAELFAWRVAMTLVPLAVGLAEAAWFFWRLRLRPVALEPWPRFLLCLAFFLCGLHTYNFLFVPYLEQGAWYYAVSQISTSLIVIGWLARSSRLQAFVAGRVSLIRVTAFLISFAFFASFFLSRAPIGTRSLLDPDVDQGDYGYYIFMDRHNAEERFGGQIPPVVSFEDGVIAYSLGAPAMSGLRYCLDAESAEYLLSGDNRKRLLAHAYRRGYRHMAASYLYMYFPFIREGAPSSLVTSELHKSPIFEDFRPWRFFVEYVSPEQTYFILRFEPAAHGDG